MSPVFPRLENTLHGILVEPMKTTYTAKVPGGTITTDVKTSDSVETIVYYPPLSGHVYTLVNMRNGMALGLHADARTVVSSKDMKIPESQVRLRFCESLPGPRN